MKKMRILAWITIVAIIAASCPFSWGILSVAAEAQVDDEIRNIAGTSKDKDTWIYQLGEDGMYIREVDFVLDNNANTKAEIIQISDIHFNSYTETDMQNATLAASYKNRLNWLPYGISRYQAQQAMDYAAAFDQTVITGDTLDTLSEGSMQLMEEYILKADPDVLVPPGNHDTIQKQSSVAETLTLDERIKILDDFYAKYDKDRLYQSKLVKDKVLCIAIDNATQHANGEYGYVSEQYTKLAADIELAKEKGYAILIFQHIILSTGNESDTEISSISPVTAESESTANFYSATKDYVIGGPDEKNEVTNQVYDLITSNADVIKGVFAGHVHGDYSLKIKAKNSDGTDATIPQYALTSNSYNDGGHAMKITVNYYDENATEVKATSVSLDKTSLELEIGKDYKLNTAVSPTNTTEKAVWASSDETVATVNSNGRVVALNEGTTTITATVGNVTATCNVNVIMNDKPNMVKVAGTSSMHHMGKTFTGLEAGTYVYSVYQNNTNGGASVPFVIENPYSVDNTVADYPQISHLVKATEAIGTINNKASSDYNKIEITFTVTEGKSYFCGVTGSGDKLPTYYTGFELYKVGTTKNLFKSAYLGDGLKSLEVYAGNTCTYAGFSSIITLATEDGEGYFAYPETYDSFDKFFASASDVLFTDDFNSATNAENDPLGNGWLYGYLGTNHIGLPVVNAKDGKAIVSAVKSNGLINSIPRVVRPASESRINQKVSVDFNSADFAKYALEGADPLSTQRDSPRVLARIQNTPPNANTIDTKYFQNSVGAIAYSAEIDWGEMALYITRLNGSQSFADSKSISLKDKISKKPTEGTYRLELIAEGTYPTKLTANFYRTDTDTLIKTLSWEDSTTELQKAGSVGMVARKPNDAMAFDSFSYFGTNAASAELTGLALSAGSLTFDSLTYTYNLDVEYEVSEITVTPTANVQNASITVNGTTVASGKASPAIPLEAGSSKTITVAVTNILHGSNIYTINVNRKNKIPDVSFTDDFSSADGNNDTDPLGNGWQYGSTALNKLTVDNGKVLLDAGDNNNAYNRVVRPASEARINQKVSINFDSSDLNLSSAGQRYRLLARVQNNPANEGKVLSYSAELIWNDEMRISKFVNGEWISLASSNSSYATYIAPAYVPYKSKLDGTYRFEFLVEGTNPTKLTLNYYNTNDGIETLLYTKSITDNTAELQNAGTVGFHSVYLPAIYRDFNYFGTNQGNKLPKVQLSDLSLSTGSINFSSDVYAYDLVVENEVSKIGLVPTTDIENATITVNGTTVASGVESSAISLEAGVQNVITVVVSKEVLGSKTYKVTVFRKEKTEDVFFTDDFSTADGNNATDPLGKGWQYGSTALEKLTVEDGKVVLKAGDNENSYNRVVRPTSEARLNQKVSINFDAADLNKNSTATDRFRLLLRVQNNPANDGKAVSYYVSLDWADGIKIGKVVDGTRTELASSQQAVGGWYIPYTKPASGTYRFEFIAEGSNPTKLTVNYYEITDGTETLINGYTITDNTAELQGAGTAGFHASSGATCSAVYTDFSYLGSDAGNTLPKATLSDIALSSGLIEFDSQTENYYVNVSSDVSKIFVTPITELENAIITVDGQVVASGSQSSAISLKAGIAKVITVTIKDSMYSSKTYTINVMRDYVEDGDVNGDSNIDASDLLVLKKILLGVMKANEYEEALADVNNDNKVNILDFVRLKKILVADGNYEVIPASNTAYLLNSISGGADDEAEELRNNIINSESSLNITGQRYYVSPNGNDMANGKTPETAWKTLAKVSKVKFNDGDAVLLERGGVYRLDSTFLCQSGVTYSAYGDSNKPKPSIYGSSQNYAWGKLWEASGINNVWKLNIGEDVGIIVFNNGEAVGNKKSTLDSLACDGDFYHSITDGILYLYLENYYPNAKYNSIEMGTGTVMYVPTAEAKDIIIDNLTIKYGGKHGIAVGANASNIKITNCEIGWIGGCYTDPENTNVRYGNGIEFWLSCEDMIVDNCWIYQAYDSGFSFQGKADNTLTTYKDISVINTLIELCSMSVEIWDQTSQYSSMENVEFSDNIFRFSGYGWASQRGNFYHASHFTDYGCSDDYAVTNLRIENNIFDCSTQNLVCYFWNEGIERSITVSGNSFYQKAAGNAIYYGTGDQLTAYSIDELIAAVNTFDSNPKVIEWV